MLIKTKNVLCNKLEKNPSYKRRWAWHWCGQLTGMIWRRILGDESDAIKFRRHFICSASFTFSLKAEETVLRTLKQPSLHLDLHESIPAKCWKICDFFRYVNAHWSYFWYGVESPRHNRHHIQLKQIHAQCWIFGCSGLIGKKVIKIWKTRIWRRQVFLSINLGYCCKCFLSTVGDIS